jgi:hypothetical protein
MLREDTERLMLGTPRDYLQKIFNIPFVLPAMTPHGFDTMLRRLTKPRRAVLGSAEPAEATDHTAPPAVDGAPGTVPPPVEQGSEVAAILTGATVEPTGLSGPELRILSSLAPLVRSPREAKRLLNLYRILRSTQALGDTSRFLGEEGSPDGDFQAVAILLGLLTADPHRVGAILFTPPDPKNGLAGGLCHRTGSQAWPAFVEGLRPREKAGRWVNDLQPALTDEARDEWQRLVDRAAPASALVTLPDLQAFAAWAPRVARYSFLLIPAGDGWSPPKKNGTAGRAAE